MGEFELEQTPLIDESSKIIRASEIRVGSGSDAAFRATPDGVNITGLNQGSLLDIQGWTFAGTFSATDADTVAWTTGALTFSDGTSYTISAGNTGNMAAITYIYFSKAASTTVLQTTTTAATSVGANKVLICVAKNETGKNATFQAFNSKGIGALITADNIAANTITTNEIAANTIAAGNMNVSQLSAIAADCGTITAGTITGATIRTAAPSASSHETVVIEGGTSQFIKFYYDTNLRAWIKGYTTEGSEVSYLIIEADSGRKLTFKNSYISCNGNFTPSSDNEYTCGATDRRWSDGRFEDITVDDITVNNSFAGCGEISGCAYNEINLLNKEQRSKYEKYVAADKKDRDKNTRFSEFEQGDVLAWRKDGLTRASLDTCPCVIAVANKRGLPTVLGAEPVKVVGRVARNQFLVTSVIAGYARAWDNKLGDPPRGTVIAQALENKLDGDKGLVLAMISRL